MIRRLVWPMMLAISLSCGQGPTDGASPGQLIASLATPHSSDGALLIRITGPVTEVTGIGGHRLAAATAGSATRIVVTGEISAGDLLLITVPDTRDLSSYGVVVEQAADRDNYALFEPGGYSFTLRVK